MLPLQFQDRNPHIGLNLIIMEYDLHISSLLPYSAFTSCSTKKIAKGVMRLNVGFVDPAQLPLIFLAHFVAHRRLQGVLV